MIFWGRLIVFLSLWFIMIYTTGGSMIFSYFMFTACLMSYFFLTRFAQHLSLYVLLVMLVFVHGWVISEFMYSSLLVIVIMASATFKMQGTSYYYVLSLSAALSIVLAISHAVQIVPVLFYLLLLGYVGIRVNHLTEEKKEIKTLYTAVINENRKLHRMRTLAETVAKTEERNRIAREIHDSVGHRLTALMMKLEMLHIEKQDPIYDELKMMASESLQETREAVQTLQTTDVKGIPAVVQLIRKLEAESHLLIQFTLKEGVLSMPISNQHGVVLYRIIQEALTNVMRHATSRHVAITIGLSAIQTLSFDISNQIAAQQAFTKGFGLTNMTERIEEIGGTLDIYETETSFVIRGMMPFEEE